MEKLSLINKSRKDDQWPKSYLWPFTWHASYLVDVTKQKSLYKLASGY